MDEAAQAHDGTSRLTKVLQGAEAGTGTLVYAVDISGSMYRALPIVVKELTQAILKLPATQRIQVLAFGQQVSSFSHDPNGVRVSPEIVDSVSNWIRRLEVRGSGDTLAVIEMCFSYRNVAAAVFLTGNYPSMSPRAILRRVAELHTKSSFPFHCVLFDNKGVSPQLADATKNFFVDFAKATKGSFTSITSVELNALETAHEAVNRVVTTVKKSPLKTVTDSLPTHEPNKLKVKGSEEPNPTISPYDRTPVVSTNSGTTPDNDIETNQLQIRSVHKNLPTVDQVHSPPSYSAVTVDGTNGLETDFSCQNEMVSNSKEKTEVFLHQLGTNLLYRGYCHAERSKIRQASESTLWEVHFEIDAPYGSSIMIKRSRIILCAVGTKPSQLMAPVLVHTEGSCFKAGYAYQFISPEDSAAVKIEYTGTGEAGEVLPRRCVVIDDTSMDMIEIGLDEIETLKMSNETPHDSSAILDGDVEEEKDDILSLSDLSIIHTDNEDDMTDRKNDSIESYGVTFQENRVAEDSNQYANRYYNENTVRTRGITIKDSQNKYGSPSDKELLRREQEQKRKEANVVYQHEMMRVKAPARRAVAEAREAKRKSKLQEVEENKRLADEQKLLAQRERLARQFDLQHKVSLKYEATLKSKASRQKQYEDLSKSKQEEAKLLSDEQLEHKKAALIRRRELEETRKLEAQEKDRILTESRRNAATARIAVEQEFRNSQDALQESFDLDRRQASVHRDKAMALSREHEQERMKQAILRRREKEAERRRREAQRLTTTLDDAAKQAIEIQAQATAKIQAKKLAESKAAEKAQRKADRHIQAHLSRRLAEEERAKSVWKDQEQVVARQRHRAMTRTEMLENRRREEEDAVRRKQDSLLQAQIARRNAAQTQNERAQLKESQTYETRRKAQPTSYARIHDRVNNDNDAALAMKLNAQRRNKSIQREVKEIRDNQALQVKQASLSETNSRTIQGELMERNIAA